MSSNDRTILRLANGIYSRNFLRHSFRRSKLDIFVDILEAIADGHDKPTRIMYAANTSWHPLQEALKILLEKEFIKEVTVKGRRRYIVLDKGFSVLRYLNRIKDEFELHA